MFFPKKGFTQCKKRTESTMESKSNKKSASLSFTLMERLQRSNCDNLYNGAFSSQIITNLLSLSETQLSELQLKRAVFKRIYFIIVEILQNISRHQAITGNVEIDRQGLFILKKIDNYYYIITGNTVINRDIESITQQIEYINSKDEKELQLLYNKVLIEGAISERGGAGLGLIAIARKSKQNIATKFISIKRNLSYFMFGVCVELEPLEGKPVSASVLLNDVVDLRNILLTNNIQLNYCKKINHITFIKLFVIVNKQLAGRPYVLRRVISTFIEMSQNLSYYSMVTQQNGKNKRPVLTILQDDDEFYKITTANYVENNKVDVLKRKLKAVNNLEKNQYETAFRNILEEQLNNETEKPDLSFLEMRIASRQRLDYVLIKVNEKYSFFELQTSINKY